MPTLPEAKHPDTVEDKQPREAAVRKRWRLRPPQKALAAVLAAGLAVPRLEASFESLPSIRSTLAHLDRDYAALVQKIGRLREVPEVAPTFKTLLYMERAAEALIPETWASLPGDRFPAELHRYLLLEDDFVDFLTSRDSSGHPKLSASDAVRVYCSALVASRVFHIPPSLLLCLLLQESRLSTTAISPTGAQGAGQLTAVAIEEVDSLLTQSSRLRGKMRLYQDTLSRLYGDPTTRKVLGELVPELRLPVFARINRVERFAITEPLVRRVRLLLEKKHPELAAEGQLQTLCERMRDGQPLAAEQEPVARAYRIAATELYNVQPGNTFNPETNVAVSAMLFRHYMRYPWSLEGRRLVMPFALRCALAVLAYNQGPRAGQRILKHIAGTGLLSVEDLSIRTLLQLYSVEMVQEALGPDSGMRSGELYRHFEAVMGCALSGLQPADLAERGAD